MHPLTPLLRGGLVVVIVVGLVIGNFRDRIVALFLPDGVEVSTGDPVDFVLDHGLVALALAAVVVVVVVLIGLSTVSWRFHTFRITGDDVEVRQGVLFRSQRRAPLDRVQGVNLTRPMLARLVGLAKLEVVGAGTDGNVKLEYLRTTDAETVRADILRLASGARLAAAPRVGGPGTMRSAMSAMSAVSAGVTGIIEGAEEPIAEPESVVHIPVGRLVASRLLGAGTVWLVVMVGAFGAAAAVWSPFFVLGAVPAVLATAGFWVRSTLRAIRYSIAPTTSGVRVTFGLFTTVTEILPPGRVHALEVRQSILWRPFGWWSVAVNRLSGRAAESAGDQFTVVLPVGTRADVERLLRLLLPAFPEDEWPDVFENGILGPLEGDPYTNTPPRARLLRPLSWRRNGVLVTADALFVRRGVVWRTLGVFPLARLQSIGLVQGPIARAFAVAGLHPHTIAGPVLGTVGALDLTAATAAWRDAEVAAVAAAERDHSHRWADA